MLVQLKGIHRVKRKLSGGTTRYHYYVVRNGPKFWTCDDVPVREPVPDKFKAAYEAAREALPTWAEDDGDTIRDLIRTFRAKAMPAGDETRKSYERAFKLIDPEFGSAKLRLFADKRMRRKVVEWHRTFSATPRTADMHLGVLVRLLNYAKRMGIVDGHAIDDIERLHDADRAHVIWTPEEVELFCQGDRRRKIDPAPFVMWLGCQFLRLTGLRRGDAIAIPLTADKGQWLEWKTGKTGADVVVPVTKELRAILEAGKRHRKDKTVEATTILFNSHGQPWTARGFSASFNKRKVEVGIEKHLHDLRGTAATEFMRAGITDEEIAEIMGWKTADVRKIRRRYVTRAAIVSAAVKRLEKNAPGT